MSNFRVGQKVVCVRTPGVIVAGYSLLKDEIYTCAGYSKHPASVDKNEMLIKEHPAFGANGYDNYCCAPDTWFKPLKLDYDFVEETIKNLKPKHHEESIEQPS